ncbi:hypothetical protein AJ80_03024 [Polytolypa hystricis UAMH7299]|uniref:thioredoxin-dependent peroxiredoxin n=1 Tax=Polytolypa hystricis (strain UAMH7299) TaxID=1447883 RepID=A0A2B7YKK3_POLH7|nr:hypothetical protein AJ80_03024 [Polytolypa hystricis UAMH7299]
MAVLRKRKPAAQPAEPPAKVAKTTAKAKAKATPTQKKTGSTRTSKKVPVVGDVIDLDDFGGEISTEEGTPTTLKSLVEESKSGVVLFTYPRASTPGCTKQVCLFRDGYTELTSTGLSIFGLSTDSPKANANFKSKQNLPYPLLCDPSATLIGALGFKKVPKGTTRGVFVVDKSGKVLLLAPGSPAGTVEAVGKLVEEEEEEGEEEGK